MGRFNSEDEALDALLSGDITEKEFGDETAEFRVELRRTRKTETPTRLEERPRADLDESSRRKEKVQRELTAFDRSGRNIGAETQEDREPTRHLFGKVGELLGLTDIASQPAEEQTVRGAIARGGLPLLEKSPTREAFEQGKLTVEEAAEALISEAGDKEEAANQLDIPLLGLGRKTLFGFENPLLAEGRATQAVAAQRALTGASGRLADLGPLKKVLPDVGLVETEGGLAVRSKRPELVTRAVKAREFDVPVPGIGDTKLDALQTFRNLPFLMMQVPIEAASQAERRKVLHPGAAELGLALESDGQHILRIAGLASDVVFEGLAELPALGPGLGDLPAATGRARRRLQEPATEGGEPRAALERIGDALSIALDPELRADPANAAELREVGDIAKETLGQALRDMLSVRSVSEQQLGIGTQERLQTFGKPGLRPLPEEDPISGWLRRSALSLERGTGLSGSTANASVNAFGDTAEARLLGTLAGLPVEVMMNAESAFIAPFSAAAGALRGGRAALKARPAFVSAGDAFVEGTRKSPLSVGQFYAEEIAQSMAAGKFNPRDAPEEINSLVNELAIAHFGMGIDELFVPAGLEALDHAPLDASKIPDPSGISGAMKDGIPIQRGQGKKGGGKVDYPTHDKRGNPITPTSMTEFYSELEGRVGEAQVNLPRHIGYEKLKHLTPEQSIKTPKYALLNHADEPVASGDLGQVVKTMLERGMGGDQVWFGAERKLGAWGKAERKLVTDFMFASPDEKKVFDAFVKHDPRATPNRLRFVKRGSEVVALGGRRADPGHAKRHLLRSMNGRTSTPIQNLTPEQLRVASLYDEAYSIWGKGQLGSDSLVTTPWGGVMTKAGMRSLVKNTLRDFQDTAGVNLKTVAMLPDKSGLKLSPKQRQGLNNLSDQIGSAVRVGPDNVVTPKDINELREGVMRAHAEISTDATFAMRGTLPVSEWLMEAIFDLFGASNKSRFKAIGAAGGQAFVQRIWSDPDELSRPPKVRQLWKEFQRRVDNVPDDLLQEVQLLRKAARQGGVTDAFRGVLNGDLLAVKVGLDKTFGSFDVTGPLFNILGNYRPVTMREVRLLDEVRSIPHIIDPDRVFELRDRMLKSVRHLKKKEWGVRALDPGAGHAQREKAAAQVYDGLMQLDDRMSDQMADLAKKWTRAHVPQAHMKDAGIARNLDAVKKSAWVGVYKEIYGPVQRTSKGQAVRGPALEAMLDAVVGPETRGLKRSPPNEAAARVVLELRHDEALAEVAGRMLQEGLGISDPHMAAAVSDALAGRHQKILDDGRVRYSEPQHIQAEVNGYMRRLGLAAGSNEPMLPLKNAPDVFVPESIQKFIDRAADLGFEDSRKLAGDATFFGTPLSNLLRYTKESMTYGVLSAIKPAHFLGNALGGVFQMHITLGTADTVGAFFQLGKNFPLALELMKRTGGLQGSAIWPARSIKGRIYRPGDGRIFHIDDMEADMRRLGVDQALGSFENRVSFLDDIGRQEPGLVNFMKRNIVGWQEFLREFSDAPERLQRIGVYLNELKKGKRVEDAAAMARKSNYDYSTLTDFERKNLRWVFLFYTFTRKNTDAMVKAAVDHPERVFRQFRFFRNQREAWGQEDYEAMLENEGDISRLILGVDDVHHPDGTVNSAYTGNYMMSNPLGAPEFFLPWAEYARDMWNFDLMAMVRSHADSMAPGHGTLAKIATMTDLGTGYSLEGFGANEMPPWLERGNPISEGFFNMFDVHAIQLKKTTKAAKEQPGATAELGVPAVYVANNHAQWIIYKDLFGAATRTTSQQLKLLQHWNDPDPVAQERSSFEKVKPMLWWGGGLRPVPQKTREEVRRLRNLEKQSQDTTERLRAKKVLEGT